MDIEAELIQRCVIGDDARNFRFIAASREEENELIISLSPAVVTNTGAIRDGSQLE